MWLTTQEEGSENMDRVSQSEGYVGRVHDHEIQAGEVWKGQNWEDSLRCNTEVGKLDITIGQREGVQKINKLGG